ncbi:MAG: DegV family protein [Lachnospiraceae bacterium]|nr:DegV family protein [Lachnospiraceae bacterium]
MFRIYADSTNDLSPDYISRNDIRIIPLYITMGDRTGKDGIDIGADEIFKWAEANKTVPKTAAFSPEDITDIIKELKGAGEDAVFIGISGDFSSTCQAVRLAVQEHEYEEHFEVIDSRNLSTGIGLVIMEAVRLREQGKDIRETAASLNEMIPRVRASFVIDTLEYLHRGGRCSSVAKVFAGALNIKPKIVVEDGKMHVDKKYRGSLRQVIMKYVRDMEGALEQADRRTVYITHSGVDKEIVTEVKAYLESLSRFEEITETRAGGIISCHCGPGTLGVLFVSEG